MSEKKATTARATGEMFKCPFCSGKAGLVEETNGEKRPGVVHTIPMCKEFEEKGPLEYLQAVNKKLLS